jgi:hypothetical protein
MTHRNLALLRGLDEAFNHGHVEAALAASADECAVHIAGRSTMAGDHIEVDALAGLMRHYAQALGDSPEMDTQAILADDEHGVMLQRIAATQGPQHRDRHDQHLPFRRRQDHRDVVDGQQPLRGRPILRHLGHARHHQRPGGTGARPHRVVQAVVATLLR